jgi:hypothetical protein
MAFYKLKKDFKTSFFNVSTGKQNELYWKIGSVIDGKPNGSNVTTTIGGKIPIDGIIGVTTIDIPVDFLETSSETKNNIILGSSSTNQEAPKDKKTFFTTKNIVIGVVGIVAILGILKWKKII